jgi:thiamine kinase-like enzyme
MSTDGESLERIRHLRYWSGPVDPVRLVGGITNRNYVVSDRGDKFVVRLGDDVPIHGIRRSNELAVSRAAFEAGVSPQAVYAERGALVLRFIEGRTLTPELMRDPALLPAAVDLVKRCHERIPGTLVGLAPTFRVFDVIRGYADEVAARSSPHVHLMPELRDCAAHLERVAGPTGTVFGHNDLLAANFIDDGARLWLIDWDYAGFNTPLFDLGGLVSNSDLDAQQARFVLERYYGHVDGALERRFAAMKCAAVLRETLWSMVSEIHSTIQFDYVGYSKDTLDRFRRAWHELPGAVR